MGSDRLLTGAGRPLPRLDLAAEQALSRRAKAGDVDAVEELAQRHVRFVVHVAKHFVGRGLALDDLVGEGSLGLLKAIQAFDPDRGVRFNSYANYWIRQTILAALARHGGAMLVPSGRSSDVYRMHRAMRTLTTVLERLPTTAELVQATGLTPSVVEGIVAAQYGTAVGFDAPMSGPGTQERRPLTDVLASGEDIAAAAVTRDTADRLHAALNTLPAREAEILRLYYGLHGAKEHTLEQIAQGVGLTRERVRQLRDRAMKELRATLTHPPTSPEALDLPADE